MNSRFPKLICLMIYFVAGPWNVYAASNLEVAFNYHGKAYHIQGERIDQNTYCFNKGAEKKIAITTLDWPPYIAKDICGQGWVQQLTVVLLASQGYEVTCTFFPWARTIMLAEKGKVDILYPEYVIEADAPSNVIKGTKRLGHLVLSEKLPGGPIAFVKRKGETDHLYYAVSKKRPQWRQTLEMINHTLAEFQSEGELFRIIQQTNHACGFEMPTLKPNGE